jgi:hypothetical protein
MSGKRGLSDDEIEVWTTVTRSIKPLKKARRAVKTEPVVAPPPRKAPVRPLIQSLKSCRLQSASLRRSCPKSSPRSHR